MTYRDFMAPSSLVNTHALITFEVDLEARACSYRWWQVVGISCRHSLTILREKGLPREEYNNEHFLYNNFRLTYEKFFITIVNMSQQTQNTDIVVKPPRQWNKSDAQWSVVFEVEVKENRWSAEDVAATTTTEGRTKNLPSFQYFVLYKCYHIIDLLIMIAYAI